MKHRVRAYLAELREGARILASREFWNSFRRHYSSDEIAHRLDLRAWHIRNNTGQPPDRELERRLTEYDRKKKGSA